MKTFIRNTMMLLLGAMVVQLKSQTMTLCAGTSTVVTATNTAGLTNPTYSLNPGGISSANPSFTVAPLSSVVYTLYTTGTNSASSQVTTTNTISVSVSAVTFSVVSSTSFSLACGVNSASVVHITNVQTLPNLGGAVSFSFLPNSTVTLPPGVLSAISSATFTSPGAWYAVVRDHSSGCDFYSGFTITSNIIPPVINGLSTPQSPLSCSSPTAVLQVAQDPGLNYNWLPWSVQSHSLVVSANSISPTSSLLATATLVVTDNSSQCMTTTIFPVYQNLYPPMAVIGGLSGPCHHSVMLTNQSMTGIPVNTFPTNSVVIGYLWEGPSPQIPVSVSSSYVAHTSGQYTLTALDLNNGCVSKANFNFVQGPVAAFVHTVTGGQAVFNDASSGIGTGTSYFWDFGDGNTSTLQHPTHNYTNGGAHLVKFKIMTPGIPSCKDSVIQSVNVSGVQCNANSNFSMVPTVTAQVWNVVPSYPWNVASARWDWGDGSSSNTLYTSHQYSAAGLYSICLSVTVSCAASSSTCNTYSVYRVSQSALIISVNVVNPEVISGLSEIINEPFSWNIIPNPNGGNFELGIRNFGPGVGRLVISDLSGRSVHEQLIDPDSSVISVHSDDLPAGMYLVTLENNYTKVTKRMAVNR